MLNASFVVVDGISDLAGIYVGAQYRSFFAYPDGATTEDLDGSGHLPFGPGWLASWGERLLAHGGPGSTVHLIEPSGLKRTILGSIATSWTETQTGGPESLLTSYSYPPDKGTRLVYDHVQQASGQPLVGIWFREFPDRTRIEYEPTSVSGEYRIRRIFYGSGDTGYQQPRWEVTYHYDSSGRLVRIEDPRDYSALIQWSDVDASSDVVLRVTKVSLTHPAWNPTGYSWSDLDIDFFYRSGDFFLERVQYPAQDYLHDLNGNGSYADSGESVTGQRTEIKFSYQGSNDARWTKLERWIAGAWSTVLATSYSTTVGSRWRVYQQGEGPSGLGGDRVHTFTYNASTPAMLTWADPSGVQHVMTVLSQGSSPLEQRISHYQRIAASGDPRAGAQAPGGAAHHGTLNWSYTWDSCGCGRLLSVTLPSGQSASWAYDAQERGFVTSYTIYDTSLTGPRPWTWSYRDWGAANDWSDFEFASRLSAHDGEGPHDWSFNYVLSGSERISTVTPPVSSLAYSSGEDLLGRTRWTEEPSFQAEDGSSSGTSKGRIEFEYGNAATDPNFHQLVTMREFAGLSQSSPVTSTFSYDARGNVVSETDPLGRVTTTTYDRLGRAKQVTLPAVTPTHPSGGSAYTATISFDYDSFGGIARVRRAAKNANGGSYSQSELLSETVCNAFGEPVRSRTERGSLTSGTEEWLESIRTFDKLGRLTSVTSSPGGEQTTYVLDSHGMIFRSTTQLTSSTSATREFWYTVEGMPQVELTADSTPIPTKYTYDSYRRIQKVENTISGRSVEVTAWDPNDLATHIVSKLNGNERSEQLLDYDAIGRLESSGSGDVGGSPWHSVSYEWNGLHLKKATDTNGRWQEYTVDPRGLLRRRIDPLGNETIVHERDNLGVVKKLRSKVAEETPSGAVGYNTYETQYAHDAWNRTVAVHHKGLVGSSSTATGLAAYDGLGNLVWQQDAVGKAQHFEHDALGRILKSTVQPKSGSSQSNVVLTRSYVHGASADHALKLILRNDQASGNHETAYVYDLAGRLVREELPGFAGGTSIPHSKVYSYDVEGRLSSWRDGNNVTVSVVRDSQMRPIARIPSVAGATTVPSIMTTAEQWDWSGEVNRIYDSSTLWGTWPAAGTPQGLVRERSTFDRLGRLLSEQYGYLDTDGTLGISPEHTDTITHGYAAQGGDDTGFRRSLGLGAANWTVLSTPDAAGKLRSMSLVSPGAATSDLATYRYEGGRVASRDLHLGSGSDLMRSTYGVNSLGILTTVDHRKNPSGANALLWKLTREVDLAGNVTKEQVEDNPGTGWSKKNYVDHYQLDGFDRVQGAKLRADLSSAGQSFSQVTTFANEISYLIDQRQNLTQIVDTPSGGVATTTSFTLETGSDRYASSTVTTGNIQSSQVYLYDGNGNLIQDGHYVYVYDYLDRLCEIYEIFYEDGEQLLAMGKTDEPRNYTREGRYATPGVFLTNENLRRKVELAREHLRRGELRAGDRPTLRSLREQRSGSTSSASSSQSSVTLQLVALYGYDTSHRRILRTTAFDAHWNAYDGWQLVQETVNAGGTLGWKVRKVYLEGRGLDEHLGYLVRADLSTNTWTRYNYVQHPLGHVHGVLDATGGSVQSYRYSPYGALQADTQQAFVGSPNRYGYAGRPEDIESGLKYYRHRYFSSAMGRFMSGDWIGPFGDGANWGNQYAYVGGAPVASTDPLGLYRIVIIYRERSSLRSDTPDRQHYDNWISEDPEGGILIEFAGSNEGSSIELTPATPGGTTATGRTMGSQSLEVVISGHGSANGDGTMPQSFSFERQAIPVLAMLLESYYEAHQSMSGVCSPAGPFSRRVERSFSKRLWRSALDWPGKVGPGPLKRERDAAPGAPDPGLPKPEDSGRPSPTRPRVPDGTGPIIECRMCFQGNIPDYRDLNAAALLADSLGVSVLADKGEYNTKYRMPYVGNDGRLIWREYRGWYSRPCVVEPEKQ